MSAEPVIVVIRDRTFRLTDDPSNPGEFKIEVSVTQRKQRFPFRAIAYTSIGPGEQVRLIRAWGKR